MDFIFRQAQPGDTAQIWAIILQSKERMRLRGTTQWQQGYPAQDDIARDIAKGYGYVLCAGDTVAAYGAVCFDGEEAYEAIDGSWLNGHPYVVVHRLAISEAMTRQGLGKLFMEEAGKLALQKGVRDFRVDTNHDNMYMQKILASLGFVYCGRIAYDNDPRMAYHKIL